MYKDNLKPLSLFDVIFNGAIIPLVRDKRERLLLHIAFALFLKLGLYYLFIYFWNSENVSLLERLP